MADATYAIPHFLGGEISGFAQGRSDKPDYRVSLNVCLNSFPVEIGAHARRPGTQYCSHTRGGAKGRTFKFDFEQSNPITVEATDGFVRFRNGTVLITTNDAQVVVAVSAANPAVVQTTAAVTWATGDTLIFPGASTPLLENRQFTATKIDTTHFSLADAITGANIDGSTLGALVAGATVAKVHELATVYVGGLWSGIRAVQAETTNILLTAGNPPQALTVSTLPSTGVNAQFAIAAATFNDGPYLDSFTNGAQVTPNALKGLVNLTVSFPAYDSAKAYGVGAFVTSSTINYVSLTDQNVGNTPVSSPSAWTATSPNAAINNGLGFLGTDVGRLIRLFSEPATWAIGTTYAVGNVISYNPSGFPGASTYWQSLTGGNVGHVPGTDTTNWQLMTNSAAALWSWGKITALSNAISGATGSSIGNLTAGGGLSSAFDGNVSKAAGASAEDSFTGGVTAYGTVLTLSNYVGKNFSGGGGQQIEHVTVYPSTDLGFGAGSYLWTDRSGKTQSAFFFPTFVMNLRGKSTLPASASDGTLLGTSGSFANRSATVTIVSTDQSTSYNYVWVELVASTQVLSTSGGSNYSASSYRFTDAIAQVVLFNPPGTGSTSGITVEILGPALLYVLPIQTWRLGVYSNTTGFPTCGIYNDGRLYLGGAVGNRFDACVANGIVGSTINFAPTDQFGAVSAASSISYTFNSKGVNQILWMKPDLQGIKAGTQAGEWLVQAPTAGSISPLNITARQVTSHGSANIEPVDTEHTLVFVQRFAKKLLEYFPDVFSGKFSAPNLADKAQHITRGGVAELAYTSAVTPIIWGRDLLGALFGITYKRDSLASSQPPTFYGWHRHTLGTGRVVESICAGPSTGGNLDALTMVTNDALTNIRHVEVLTDTMDEDSTLASAWFLDDAVNPTSTSTTNAASAGAPYGGLTINGLWHLNGATVQVFAGGLDCGDRGDNLTTFTDFVVSNGSVFVPYGDGVSAGSGRGLFTVAFAAGLSLSQIVIGATYNSDGQLVRMIAPADTGARNGPALGKLRRNHRYAMLLSNTRGISIGATFAKLFPVKLLKTDRQTPIDTLSTFSGVAQDALSDDYSYDGMICWRVSRPFPANVVAISGNVATQDQ